MITTTENDMSADQSPVLAALSALELKLTELIRTSLALIVEQHTRSTLEQAKLNATFATRDRVEAIATNVHDRTNEIMVLNHRITQVERNAQETYLALHTDTKDMRTKIDDLTKAINDRTIHTFTSGLGYLITAIIVLSGAGITALVTHLLTSHH